MKIFNEKTHFPFSAVEKMYLPGSSHAANGQIVLNLSVDTPVAFWGHQDPGSFQGKNRLPCTQETRRKGAVMVWHLCGIWRARGSEMPDCQARRIEFSAFRTRTPARLPGVPLWALWRGVASTDLVRLSLSPAQLSALRSTTLFTNW